MDLEDKLRILTDAAKYDVACTSSGASRRGKQGSIGNASPLGCCHSFSADGRCISLLKLLMSNACIYDCAYCVNRKSNDIRRASLSPRELAELTIQFYRRNYIEGLFLSSSVIRNADYTMERMIEALRLLREEYHFRGYIHAKTIPGAAAPLVRRLGELADRLSVNIELPSENSLTLLAPDKTKQAILTPMKQIRDGIQENSEALVKYHNAPKFAASGQSTQMIVGASGESDYQILKLTEGLYGKYKLKRVFFSAYVPIVEHRNLPSLQTKPPLLREHRLYQADWLLRFYGFHASELLDEKNSSFNPLLDPKCNWAMAHPEFFPVNVNKADREALLRVPGIGVNSVNRILTARRHCTLDEPGLRKLGVVMKRAGFFIECGNDFKRENREGYALLTSLVSDSVRKQYELQGPDQMTMFEPEDLRKCLSGQL